MISTRYSDVVEALRHAANALEQDPALDPVTYLRECVSELEDE